MGALQNVAGRVGLKINTHPHWECGERDRREDIATRIRKAQQAFATPRTALKEKIIFLTTKLRIFNSKVKSVLL